MSDIKHYNKEIEELFLNFFITDSELFVRCVGIINEKHYKDPFNRSAVAFIKEHAEQYATIPTLEQIQANCNKKLEKIIDINDNHKDWFLDSYERFAQHRELENIIYSGPDLLEEGRYGEILSKVKDALAIGLVKDLGIDYFRDPASRLRDLRDNDSKITTGLKSIDDKLYGGLNRGEITIFAGQSGAGKSIFLQNFAVNWSGLGLNVVYLTLELSEKLCSMRIDAMTTGIATTDIMKDIDDVAMKVRTFWQAKHGSLRIKQLKNGCTANDIKAFIKEYEVQTNIKVDAILIDYLDLCSPYSVKVSASDQFIKDKYVSEELRNLAVELDVLMVTASQLNRSSYDTIEFDASSIAGGISKINTSDNVIGIFTTATMRDNGRYQIQFMKTRSSSGVGSKVDLGFNNKTLRLFDLQTNDQGATAVQTSVILDKLSKDGTISQQPPKPIDGIRGLTAILKSISND